MNNLEMACFLSCEEWVESLPDDVHYDFSPRFEKEMQILFDKMRNDKYHRFTKNTMTTFIVAAIILSFATTAFAIPSTREYIVKQFKDHFSYMVTDIEEIEEIENINIKYLPEGFIKNDEDISDIGIYQEYCNGDERFTVFKNPLNTSINYNNVDNESIIIDGVEYIIIVMKDSTVIIWNDGFYTFRISGNIDKDTLLQIANNTN